MMSGRNDDTAATALRITSNGQTTIYPLTPDRRLEIKGRLGISVIELRGGRARFVASPCPGQLCVLSGWHSHSGDGMACLPNRVAMSLIAEQETFDGMNF
jgi:hypothetical protein